MSLCDSERYKQTTFDQLVLVFTINHRETERQNTHMYQLSDTV